MNRHLQQLIKRGLPEEDFLTIADSHIWVRRARKDWRSFAPGLPYDVIEWPKSDKLQDIGDHLDVRERAFERSFRHCRDHYVQDWDVTDYREVPLETLMGHLLARALIIGRLARFLRAARIIELRADAKARAIRQEMSLIEEEARAYRRRIGLNPVPRITAAVRRSRLSMFQARCLASTEPGRLHVVRVDAEGTTIVVGITFRGNHRYGKWNVGSGEFDGTMLLTSKGKTIEIDMPPEVLADFQGSLTPSGRFFRPSSVPAFLDEVRRYQKEAPNSSTDARDRSLLDQARARLSHLKEIQRRRDQGRKRRVEREAKVVGHYRRWAAQSARRLLEAGVPVNAEEAATSFD